MNDKELDAILDGYFLLHQTDDLEVAKGIKGVDPNTKLKAELLAWRNKFCLEARVDELKRLLSSGERYGWGETFATDHMGLTKRLNELIAKLKEEQ